MCAGGYLWMVEGVQKNYTATSLTSSLVDESFISVSFQPRVKVRNAHAILIYQQFQKFAKFICALILLLLSSTLLSKKNFYMSIYF